MPSSTNLPTKVLLVEDETLVRKLIEDLLKSRFFEVQSAENISEAKKIARTFEPDVLITDINLGESENGVDLAHILGSIYEIKGVVFLTNVKDPWILGIEDRAIPKTSAYIHKSELKDPEILFSAIEASIKKLPINDYRHDQKNHPEIPDLSRAQIEVLKMVSEGLSNSEIALKRQTGLRAVENLLQRAYESLGIDTNDSSNARIRAAIKYLKAAGINRE